MAAGLGARHHQNIDAGGGVFERVLAGAGQRADRDIAVAAALDDRLRRHAKGVDEQADRMLEGHVQQVAGPRLAHVVGVIGAVFAGP